MSRHGLCVLVVPLVAVGLALHLTRLALLRPKPARDSGFRIQDSGCMVFGFRA
jgi:hypothetical protein